MKSNRKIAAALIGSFVLGAGAVQLLHAQTTPPAYTVAMINVKDEEGYKKDFLPEAQKMIKEGGGKYIAGGWNNHTNGRPAAAQPRRRPPVRERERAQEMVGERS